MIVRLVALTIGSIFIGGCFGTYGAKPPCGPPGTVQTTTDCHYVLQIKQILNASTGEVTGVVPRRIVEENSNSIGFDLLHFRRFHQDPDNYPFWEYAFQIEGFDASKILVGSEVDFHSVAGKRTLTLGKPGTAGTGTCDRPGHLATQDCSYTLTVTNVDSANDLVRATVAKSVVEENAKLFPNLAVKAYEFSEYTFHMRDVDKQGIKTGETYNFRAVPNSDYLVLER